MALQNDFPALFTIAGSSRHESVLACTMLLTTFHHGADRRLVLIVTPGDDLDTLKQTIEGLIASSPNAAEMLYKYRNKETYDVVQEVKVKWASEGRDKQLFPRETLLTKENCEAVLKMMAVGVGKDVFDVKVASKKVEGEK